MNTTLSAATCAITILIIARVREGIYSAPRMCNGILSGLVSITGACGVVENYRYFELTSFEIPCDWLSAILIGFIGNSKAVIQYDRLHAKIEVH